MATIRKRPAPKRKPAPKKTKKTTRAKAATRPKSAKKSAKPAKARPKKRQASAKPKTRAAAAKPKRVAKAKPKRVAEAKPKSVVEAKPKRVAKAKPKRVVEAKLDGTIFGQLAKIPSPAELHRMAVALHVLQVVAGSRFPSFVLEVFGDHQRFLYDHGSGDHVLVFFSDDGHLIRGFDHESPVSPYASGRIWPGLYAGLPDSGLFQRFIRPVEALDEEAFAHDAGDTAAPATFAAWSVGETWQAGTQKLPPFDAYQSDGARFLLGCLSPDVRFCEEKSWPRDTVARVVAHEPLSDADLRALSPTVDLAAARRAMADAGYGEPFPFAWTTSA